MCWVKNHVILSTSGCHSLETKIHICPLYRWVFAPFSFCWKKRYYWILRSVSCKVFTHKGMINSGFDKAVCVIPAFHCVPIVWSRHTSALFDIGMFLSEFLFSCSSHFHWELGTSPAVSITAALSLLTSELLKSTDHLGLIFSALPKLYSSWLCSLIFLFCATPGFHNQNHSVPTAAFIKYASFNGLRS